MTERQALKLSGLDDEVMHMFNPFVNSFIQTSLNTVDSVPYS